MKKALFAIPVAAIAAVGFTPIAHAAPITITTSYPDVTVDNGVVTLTVSGNTRVLTMTGTTTAINPDGSGSVDLTQQGNFTAVLDLTLVGSVTGANEQFTITGGNLTVTGNNTTLWSDSAPTAFGFSNTPASNAADFEIEYGPPTGALSNGKGVDVIYHSEGAIPNYGTNFLDVAFSTNANTAIGLADVAAPEPTSVALLTLAAPLLLRRRRKA